MFVLLATLVTLLVATGAAYLTVLVAEYLRDVRESVVGTTTDLDRELDASPTRCIVSLATLDPAASYRAADREFWASINAQYAPTSVGVNRATTHRAIRLAALKACEDAYVSSERTMHGLAPAPRFTEGGTRVVRMGR